MELIKQSYDIWGKTPLDYSAGLQWVEKAGRTCYRSEKKITQGSSETFIKGIVRSGHLSVIEHSNIVFRYDVKQGTQLFMTILDKLRSYFDSRWINVEPGDSDCIFVYGNWRAFYEFIDKKITRVDIDLEAAINRSMTFLNIDQLTQVTDYKDIPVFAHRYTVKLITDRAVLAEITRHRDDVGFSVESQRYCRYCTDEGQHLQCIEPWFYDSLSNEEKQDVIDTLEYSEDKYKKFILEYKRNAQESRFCLTNATAVEIVMTAYMPEWMHIFGLRTVPGAYPQMIHLMEPLYQEMVLNAQFKGI